MKMSKVGNQTNSQDPQAVNSRVFVGNLNTFQCSKTDVERMFQRYGRLVGISMHKGFAFVQFTNPFDARSACVGEDARTVLGQTLDVNLVAEPKPHQTGRKRQNLSKTGNDWEYYYNSYYAASSSTISPPTAVAGNNCNGGGSKASKRQKVSHQFSAKGGRNQNGGCGGGGGQPTAGQGLQQQSHHAIVPDQLKLYSNPDILICGNCREMFTELQGLLDHKKEYCKLRFTCKCNNLVKPNFTNNNKWSGNLNEGCLSLACVQCKESFDSAWDLMVHAQSAHMMNVYQLTTRDQITASPVGTESENGSTSESIMSTVQSQPDRIAINPHRNSENDKNISAIVRPQNDLSETRLLLTPHDFVQCSVGAQVNIDEDANGSADESLCGGRNELYEPMDNDREPNLTSPAAMSFIGETEKELTDAPPMTSSCQTCLIQQPNIQALMGVH